MYMSNRAEMKPKEGRIHKFEGMPVDTIHFDGFRLLCSKMMNAQACSFFVACAIP